MKWNQVPNDPNQPWFGSHIDMGEDYKPPKWGLPVAIVLILVFVVLSIL